MRNSLIWKRHSFASSTTTLPAVHTRHKAKYLLGLFCCSDTLQTTIKGALKASSRAGKMWINLYRTHIICWHDIETRRESLKPSTRLSLALAGTLLGGCWMLTFNISLLLMLFCVEPSGCFNAFWSSAGRFFFNFFGLETMTKNSTRARASKMLELSPDCGEIQYDFSPALSLFRLVWVGEEGKNAELFKLILIFAGLSLVSCLEQRDGFYCFKHLWCMMNYNMMEIAAVSSPVRWKLCISAICCKTGSISGPTRWDSFMHFM